MGRPDFFIVGAPKAATSALWEHLRAHPAVFMSELKEPQFFGRDQQRLNYECRTLGEYLAFFDRAEPGMRVGEASTNYLYSKTAASEIAAFAPDASVIIALREPVAIMHSYHAHMVARGFEQIRDFAVALEAEPERRKGRLLPRASGVLDNLFYRHIADLASHVERYFRVFGRDRVHLVVFDDWCSDPAAVYRGVLAFLGLDTTLGPREFAVVNEHRRVRCARVHDLVMAPPRPLVAAVRAAVPGAVRSWSRHRLLHLNTEAAPRRFPDPELLLRLRREFAPKIDALAALIERDLSGWYATPS